MNTSNRVLAIKYIAENMGEFPEPHHTGHTAVCHYGYSWEQPHGSNNDFVLENDNHDIITRSDFERFKQLMDSPIIIHTGLLDESFNQYTFDTHDLITDAILYTAINDRNFNGNHVASLRDIYEIIKTTAKDGKRYFIHTYNKEINEFDW